MIKLLLRPELGAIARTLLVLLWLAALAIFLTGCSLIAPRVGPQLAKGVNRYCEEPQGARLLLRESINAQIAPHRLELRCAADVDAPGD